MDKVDGSGDQGLTEDEAQDVVDDLCDNRYSVHSRILFSFIDGLMSGQSIFCPLDIRLHWLSGMYMTEIIIS